MQYKEEKKKLKTVMWGSEPVVWGSESMMWGSEVSFANNGVRRSEMWGSPSLPRTALGLDHNKDPYPSVQAEDWIHKFCFAYVNLRMLLYVFS